MTAHATPRDTDAERLRLLRDRLARERRRYEDARLDVRLARDRWDSRPVEEHRLALIDELTVGICLGRTHMACLDDLLAVVDRRESAEVRAVRADAADWVLEGTRLLQRVAYAGPGRPAR